MSLVSEEQVEAALRCEIRLFWGDRLSYEELEPGELERRSRKVRYMLEAAERVRRGESPAVPMSEVAKLRTKMFEIAVKYRGEHRFGLFDAIDALDEAFPEAVGRDYEG